MVLGKRWLSCYIGIAVETFDGAGEKVAHIAMETFDGAGEKVTQLLCWHCSGDI